MKLRLISSHAAPSMSTWQVALLLMAAGVASAHPPENPVTVPATKVGDRMLTGDWSMWGGTFNRNMVNLSTGIPLDFDIEQETGIRWKAKLGSQTYGNPVVAGGLVIVGTNNGGEYRPKHKGDRGVMLAFDEKSGEMKWQLTREKLPEGRVVDWPEQGICSTAAIEGDRIYVLTNRCELMCVDAKGFYDKENDGPYTSEVDAEELDADIVWILDLRNELGVFPHNLAASSPVVYGDIVYVVTGNGVSEDHLEIPAPKAPSLVAVNKKSGRLLWQDSSPGTNILHGQWASPSVGIVNGKAQVYFPGGDGILYALDAETGSRLWQFDLNPKDAKYELGGRGTRNEIISTPVFLDNSVVLAVGQDPEHGEGVGHLYRIDATKRGDISRELVVLDAEGKPVKNENGDPKTQPNPNNGALWYLGGLDDAGEFKFRRTISSFAVHEGLLYAADLSGFLHCIDFKTGERYWEADLQAAVWGSPMVVDGKVMIGDEDGDLAIYATGKEKKLIREIPFGSAIYSTPTVANGYLFVSTRDTLYSIGPK